MEVAKPGLVNVKLEIGGTTEQVIVTGETQSAVNAVTPTLSNVINTRQSKIFRLRDATPWIWRGSRLESR